MSTGDDAEEIRRVMSLLGKRTSDKKRKAVRKNIKKAQAARKKKAAERRKQKNQD